VHLHDAVVRLVMRVKGRGGVVVVSDAVADRSATRRADGTLTGSALLLDEVAARLERVGVAAGDIDAAVRATPEAILRRR